MQGFPTTTAPLPAAKLTVPVGGELEAVSDTVAVQVVVAPTVTKLARQVTDVVVGSIPESTAIELAPAGSLMKSGTASDATAPLISARPISAVAPESSLQ